MLVRASDNGTFRELELGAEIFIVARTIRPSPSSPRKPSSAMLGRDLLAISFLRWMPQPILDVWYEPLGGSQIADGMVIMLRLTLPKNSVGHPAMEQNGSYRVTFFEAVGDGSQHPVGISPDLTETLAHQVGSDIRTKSPSTNYRIDF
jgi:hypothetical protein